MKYDAQARREAMQYRRESHEIHLSIQSTLNMILIAAPGLYERLLIRYPAECSGRATLAALIQFNGFLRAFNFGLLSDLSEALDAYDSRS